jgi:hypothetical protein
MQENLSPIYPRICGRTKISLLFYAPRSGELNLQSQLRLKIQHPPTLKPPNLKYKKIRCKLGFLAYFSAVQYTLDLIVILY